MTEDSGAKRPIDSHDLFGDGWEASLTAILDRQRDLLGQIDALSERQATLIESGEGERLLGLLAQRQALSSEIETLSCDLDGYRKRWKEVAQWADDAARLGWEASMEGLARTATAIAERDARDHEAIAKLRDELAGKLAGIGKSRAAVNAYGPRAASNPAYTDRRG